MTNVLKPYKIFMLIWPSLGLDERLENLQNG